MILALLWAKQALDAHNNGAAARPASSDAANRDVASDITGAVGDLFWGNLTLLFLIGAVAIALKCPKHGPWSILWALLFSEEFVLWFGFKKYIAHEPNACYQKPSAGGGNGGGGGGNGGAYAAPQYAAPQYAAPQYAAPQYAAPQIAAPQYAAPQYAVQQ